MLAVEMVARLQFFRGSAPDRGIQQAVGHVNHPDHQTQREIGDRREIIDPPGFRENIQPSHGDERSIQAQQVGNEPDWLTLLGRHDAGTIPDPRDEGKRSMRGGSLKSEQSHGPADTLQHLARLLARP